MHIVLVDLSGTSKSISVFQMAASLCNHTFKIVDNLILAN